MFYILILRRSLAVGGCMSNTVSSDISLSALASTYTMQLTERTGGPAPEPIPVPVESSDDVNISVEGRQKLAEAMNGESKDVDDSEKVSEKEEKGNEYTAELERYIKQLQKQIKELQEQIQRTQEDQSLDDETKQTIVEQQYAQLASTQAMLLEAVDNLIEAKRKFKEEVELDMSAD